MDTVSIRVREDGDLPGCVELLAEVHRLDGYPVNWPADPGRWLCPRGLRSAWVADTGSAIVGHLVVRDATAEMTSEVGRLFVAPAYRRRGIAARLLRQAEAWATGHGTGLTLEVVDGERSAAVALYEDTGWRHVHTTVATWTAPDGGPVTLRRYARRPARYDGHADWYDSTFRSLGDDGGSAGLLARLLGPADPGDPLCVDVGCGTGLHFAAVGRQGYRVVGVDLSADQLRVAASRNPRIVRADAQRLPLGDATVSAVVMTFTHTDVDDFAAVIGEATRILRPGGRLIYLGVHPAFVGAFLDRRAETAGRELAVRAGYGDERRQHDPTGTFPMRSRVGVRYLTLATFLGAFLAQPSLRLASVLELDTAMRPWVPDPDGGRLLPWNIAVTARAG